MPHGPFDASISTAVRSLVSALVTTRGQTSAVIELDEDCARVAFAEDLAPLLGAAVSQGRVAVPRAARERLLWEHQMCVASNVVRSRATRTFADLCRQVGIPVVLLKGMAMIQSTLDLGERSMIDADLLVPASRWQQACALIIGAGFAETVLPGRGYTARHDYVRTFSNAAGVTMEIHRFVCEASFLDIDYEGADGLFARARRAPTGLLVPDDGDLFLTLAAHAAKHTFEIPLRSFFDGLFLLQRSPLKLDELAARARHWRMEAAFAMWVQSLRTLAPAIAHVSDHAPVGPRWRWGRFVWSRTRHASPWQRFVRMAWLVDGKAAWVRHVATRATFRALDSIQSSARGRTPS